MRQLYRIVIVALSYVFCFAVFADTECPVGWGNIQSVVITGKNLFDITISRIATVGSLQPDGSYKIEKAGSIGIWSPDHKVVFNGKENTQYTLSAYIKSDSEHTKNMSLGFFYSDGTIQQGSPRGSFTEFTKVTCTSTVGKTVIGFGAYYDLNENIYIKDLQIVEGDVEEIPKEYVQYELYQLPIRGSCTLCPPNTYKDVVGNNDCTPCPNSTMSPAGATSIDQCGHLLHTGNYVAFMPVGKRTKHGLCTMLDGVKYCADVYEKE